MKKKLLALGMMMGVTTIIATGCGYRETTSSKENNYTQELMEQSSNAVGYPSISNFFEKAQLKEIYELRDDPNVICYWYTRNDMSGKWIYQGKCVGFGIPYTTQFTQPETVQRAALPALGMTGNDKGYNEYFIEVLPQADPNGLYSSASTSATWILSVDEDGNINPSYVESEITVTQTKLASRLCEDWSLTDGYESMSNTAEIAGDVKVEDLELAEDELNDTSSDTTTGE